MSRNPRAQMPDGAVLLDGVLGDHERERADQRRIAHKPFQIVMLLHHRRPAVPRADSTSRAGFASVAGRPALR